MACSIRRKFSYSFLFYNSEVISIKRNRAFSIHLVLCTIFFLPLSLNILLAYVSKKASYIFGVCRGSRTRGREDAGKLLMNLKRKCL